MTTTTPTGVPITLCKTCGLTHPTTRRHCNTCGRATLFIRHTGTCIKCQPQAEEPA